MQIYSYLLDILKYTIAGLGVVYLTFYLIKPYLERGEKIQMLEFKKTFTTQTLPLRLQAYERLVLYIERVNPANMLIRINAPSYSAQELYGIIMDEVRTEYQHNITQQIYVTGRAWGVIKHVKEDTLSIVTNAFKAIPPDATGLELSKTILGQLSHLEENPYEVGADMLRVDIQELF
jgi:hypothetical protein